MRKILTYAILASTLVACGGNKKSENDSLIKTEEPNKFKELDEKARQIFGVLEIKESENNPITPEKIKLGKMLYFDKRLSKDNTQSCNTCHNLDTYGVDNKSLSEGNNGGLGGRNSPTTLNAALHIAQFWDGREPDVEAQAGGPILNPVEMAMESEKAVEDRLSGINEYVILFKEAFPNDKQAITYDNLKKAIGAFERNLITFSKFDDYMSGDDNALTEKEKEGMKDFIDLGCTACHSGALLGGHMYQKFGLFNDYWEYTKSKKVDNGKFDLTQNETDKFFFKVPSLRNVEKTAPYFHDGSVTDLKDAIRVMAKVQLNQDITENQIDNIETFLKSLTGNIPIELKQQ
ncbi:c-type cytochrome [Weeksellaceae bacterium TAE3-ERU29]|nr:c-type cytochrome [Weeksellaceae bacterium TAE3-ERU29]